MAVRAHKPSAQAPPAPRRLLELRRAPGQASPFVAGPPFLTRAARRSSPGYGGYGMMGGYGGCDEDARPSLFPRLVRSHRPAPLSARYGRGGYGGYGGY